MSDDTAFREFFAMFAPWARSHGLDEAVRRLRSVGFDSDRLEQARRRYQELARNLERGDPPRVVREFSAWYPGPLESDKYWPAVQKQWRENGWPPDRLDQIDEVTSKIVGLTPDPSARSYRGQGLVIGFVQSGKTTNFTAVAAKAADVGYRLVIVLSGVHNGLRRQTQLRMERDLVGPQRAGWYNLTDEDMDFFVPVQRFDQLPVEGQVLLAVVKKNAFVLRRLRRWLRTAEAQHLLDDLPTLVIDDEADQASVATKEINPLIREILQTPARSTYIGYTATPFANVFIDPSQDDLYPKDFIVSLPRPTAYFGPEMIFGRDVPGDDEPDLDGHDMIRVVPDEEVPMLRPTAGAVIPFDPEGSASLRSALAWFVLATAGRRAREDHGHSTMLVHTSVRTEVHERFEPVMKQMVRELSDAVTADDEAVLEELRALWRNETARVRPEAFGRTPDRFEDVAPHLGDVLRRCSVVIDNSSSDDRLAYDNEQVVAIAVGGNTLSRGLTLEGLVTSVFVRAAGTYDTLMQMGRWFGYRVGYEDLPRIWMTEELRRNFRHLAAVEHELRQDVDVYEHQNLTPLEFGVRVRTHPVLRVTAHMGAAVPRSISFSEARLQTRFFDIEDENTLSSNLAAAGRLLNRALAGGAVDEVGPRGSRLLRDVGVDPILDFLRTYVIHPDHHEMEPPLVLQYLESELRHSGLSKWNVAVAGRERMSGERLIDLGRMKGLPVIERSRLRGSWNPADIKTLMSKPDRVLDVPRPIAAQVPMAAGERILRNLRQEHLPDHGLLLLYPIDRDSQPAPGREGSREALDAPVDVLGLGLVFPRQKGPDVAARVGVDLAGMEPFETPSDAVAAWEDEEGRVESVALPDAEVDS